MNIKKTLQTIGILRERGDKLGSVLSNIDKATWKTPTEAMRDNMVGQGYNPTDAQINQQLNILKEKRY